MRIPVLALLLAFAALAQPALAAQTGHLVLLTVAEGEGAPATGGTADLYLDIRPGSGRIFVDTYPWTRLDTQSSIRLANRVACGHVEADCSQHDFFYTIRADSTIVGGPSAGAALAVLTAALLEGEGIDESIAITGTINSGGLIGPVAGVKAKALAAKQLGLSKVLISSFAFPTEVNESYLTLNLTPENSSQNITIDTSRVNVPVDLDSLGIEVKEVSTLAEALAEFRHEPIEEEEEIGLREDGSYARTMSTIASDLCSRRDGLSAQYPNATDANQTARREAARERGDWYSLASYCFSDLIKLRTEEYAGLSQAQRRSELAELLRRIDISEENLAERDLSTLAQLETSMIVAERLGEAQSALAEENVSNISAETLGFAVERVNSADVWSAFFRMESEAIELDSERLALACAQKRIEAEERINYVELYLPEEYLEDARRELVDAQSEERRGDYTMCLFRASKAQAQADLLASSLSVPKEKVDWLVEKKLAAAARVIAEEQENGRFPILGYSYYRYAQSLKGHDPYSALTFAEYSLEFSNLGLYFPPEPKGGLAARELYLIALFASGVVLGGTLGFIVATNRLKRQVTRRKIKKA